MSRMSIFEALLETHRGYTSQLSAMISDDSVALARIEGLGEQMLIRVEEERRALVEWAEAQAEERRVWVREQMESLSREYKERMARTQRVRQRVEDGMSIGRPLEEMTEEERSILPTISRSETRDEDDRGESK